MRSTLTLTILLLAALQSPLAAQYATPLSDPDYADADANVFLPDEVTMVTVTMDPLDLQAFLADTDLNVYADCTVQIVNSQINETYLNVGIRPRGNSARGADKNPWKLSFNEFVPGRRFHGLKKMNLGGDAPDPTMSRSSTLFKIFRESGVPASRTHHVWLEINDGVDVSGVFVHHEQVDEIFVKAWFGNDDGRLYKCRNKNVPANLTFRAPGNPSSYSSLEAYEEQNAGGDFLLLAEFIDFLNNSADANFAAEIGDWLNVDGFLRAQAVDVVSGQWDGLWIGGNNYYLYENTETGLLEYIPWDLDHSFGMDYLFFPIIGNFGTDFATKKYENWGNNGFAMNGSAPPPLVERVLNITAYDEALKQMCHDSANGPFHPANSYQTLDDLKTLLAPLAFTGSFSGPTMDNGYDNSDFLSGYDSPSSYSLFVNPATWGVKPFIERRRAYVASNFPTPIAAPQVFVNEAMADNETYLADEAGEFDDWVELYNNESFDVDLSGWFLGERPGAARTWEFPAGTIIPAKGHLLIWCDDDAAQGPLHANFKLSASGESVHLWLDASSGHVQVDSLIFPDILDDESFGRFPDGTDSLENFAAPTPLDPNAQGGFALRVNGHCPGKLQLHAAGASPSGQVAFLGALGAGSFTIPAVFPCAGLVLDLDPNTITLIGLNNADANGRASLGINPPANLCGAVVLQALDINGCLMTETAAF